MLNLFHKTTSDKTISEKGLSNVIHYTNKVNQDIAQLADHNRVAANNFMTYGSLLGENLSDVTNKMGHLFMEWSNVLMDFSDVMNQYRDTLKSISAKEATLQSSRDQKRKLRENIDKLQGSLSSLDKMNALKQQLAQLETFTEPDEVELENFKRIATREALYNLLNGMHAMASKTDIVSNYGKYIVDELDATPIQPGQKRDSYTSQPKTKKIHDEAKRLIDEWSPEKAKFRRTMTTYYGYNPLLDKPLPTTEIKRNQHGPIDDDDEEEEEEYANNDTDSNTSNIELTHDDNTNAQMNSSSAEDSIVIPMRTISLEEQYRQYTFYKPDDIVEDRYKFIK